MAESIDYLPKWEPLRRLLGARCSPDAVDASSQTCPEDDWIRMYAALPNSERPRIDVYKHRATRRYLMLDCQGNVYHRRSEIAMQNPGAYERLKISPELALDAVARNVRKSRSKFNARKLGAK